LVRVTGNAGLSSAPGSLGQLGHNTSETKAAAAATASTRTANGQVSTAPLRRRALAIACALMWLGPLPRIRAASMARARTLIGRLAERNSKACRGPAVRRSPRTREAL